MECEGSCTGKELNMQFNAFQFAAFNILLCVSVYTLTVFFANRTSEEMNHAHMRAFWNAGGAVLMAILPLSLIVALSFYWAATVVQWEVAYPDLLSYGGFNTPYAVPLIGIVLVYIAQYIFVCAELHADKELQCQAMETWDS